MTRKKNGKKATLSTLATAGLASSALSLAQSEPPRGQDIRPYASNCSIGPFEQTGKAGEYNRVCNEMADAEKCLALLKKFFNRRGHMYPPQGDLDQERTAYCLEQLKTDLLGGSES